MITNTDYTDEVVGELCELVRNGMSLKKAARKLWLPVGKVYLRKKINPAWHR